MSSLRQPRLLFVIRNGKLYARRTSLGAARSVIANVQSVAGKADRWSIMDGRKVMYRA